jgi:phosphoribosylformylglycinamidine synthase PurS subunit
MAKVKVYVTLKPTLLDAQGRVVANALQNLGYDNVEEVRMGKYIEIEVKENGKPVSEQVDEMCRRLLANPNIENYKFEVLE